MLPLETISAFDTWLAERGHRFEAVVIGGAALALLGITDRPTRDVDILAPELPLAVQQAAIDFAVHKRAAGVHLADDWLNNGPAQLCDALPSGWTERLRPTFEGAALVLMTLAREDLLKTKLFALCDRGTDIGDCLALAPTSAELVVARPWLRLQDTNFAWPDHVDDTLDDLLRRLGDGV